MIGRRRRPCACVFDPDCRRHHPDGPRWALFAAGVLVVSVLAIVVGLAMLVVKALVS